MEDSHKELARDVFEKITEYLNGELAGVCSSLVALFPLLHGLGTRLVHR